MTDHTKMTTAERIADLERKLASREGLPAFRDNVPVIRAEIERLKGSQKN